MLKSEGRRKKKEGDRYFGGQQGSLWCFPFDGLPVLRSSNWERRQGYKGINWRRALVFSEFYIGPAALIHYCSMWGHQFSAWSGATLSEICNLCDYSYHYYIKLSSIFSSVNLREDRQQKGLYEDWQKIWRAEGSILEFILFPFLLAPKF